MDSLTNLAPHFLGLSVISEYGIYFNLMSDRSIKLSLAFVVISAFNLIPVSLVGFGLAQCAGCWN